MRGLVSATNALTRAPNGRCLGLAPMTPEGRESTAVTNTSGRNKEKSSKVPPVVDTG